MMIMRCRPQRQHDSLNGQLTKDDNIIKTKFYRLSSGPYKFKARRINWIGVAYPDFGIFFIAIPDSDCVFGVEFVVGYISEFYFFSFFEPKTRNAHYNYIRYTLVIYNSAEQLDTRMHAPTPVGRTTWGTG